MATADCRRYRWLQQTCNFVLQCKDNNKSATVLECFLSGVSKFGLPHRVTSDKGLENTAVADFIISARGPGKVSMIRKERIYYNLFQFMEEQNIMDPLNDSHVAALQYTFS